VSSTEDSQFKDIAKDMVDGLIVVEPPQSGEVNMATDNAMLGRATSDWPVILRIYRWETPTLSLGHFQSDDDLKPFPHLRELPCVRRKTGGGAIVHDCELTYSLLIPNRNNAPAKGHSETLYRAVHESISANLRLLGWQAGLSEACTCGLEKKDPTESFLCFLRRSPVDLVVEEHKIVGSAQRRTATGLLQHGSLLLRRSPSTPDLLGLLDIDLRLPSPETLESKKMWFNEPLDAVYHRENSRALTPNYHFWTEFLIANLKTGLSKVLQCTWSKGTLNNWLESDASR